MTVEIYYRYRLLHLRHYTKVHIHQPREIAEEHPLCKCTSHKQWRRSIDQFLRDCLAGGGRTGRLDRARLWDCGLAGCIVHLTGVIDCVLGEGEDTA